MPLLHSILGLVLLLALSSTCSCAINRLEIIRALDPVRNLTNATTPMQVGNGNFAFNADITGLQTIRTFNTLSSWGWHNSSLPRSTPGNPESSQWLASNPQRINLGRIGLLWEGREIKESELEEATQTLNLSSGIITSSFTLYEQPVLVRTAVHPMSDTVSCFVSSDSLTNGSLTIFMDFPYPKEGQKFEAPFVGDWNASSKHKTNMSIWAENGEIRHDIDATTYYASFAIGGKGENATMIRQSASSHRYVVKFPEATDLELSVTYSLKSGALTPRFDTIKVESGEWWTNYWQSGAFLDCTPTDPRAAELQRRVILSQYLQAVNSAGSDPPQDSGLVNNGWYGKFHLEMIYWHLAHWTRWSKWDQIRSEIPYVYDRFVAASQNRARVQGYAGARWGELSDPSGRTAPGEANALLIWQQPHPFLLAELEYRAFPTSQTLTKWKGVLAETEKFMTSYPHWNTSTKVYDLGPPLQPASGNTDTSTIRNPTFELAYWRFGLDIAAKWYQRQGLPVPANITHVYENLAAFPVENGSYVDYQGIAHMWTDPKHTSNHPMLLGINGMLPPDPRLNANIFATTVANVYRTWDLKRSDGWDFPLLAMTAARMGDAERAVDWLLHPLFQFDDVGMPLGGERETTPYFPSGGGLLMAVAMMADGWEGKGGGHWPKGWSCQAEGFAAGL